MSIKALLEQQRGAKAQVHEDTPVRFKFKEIVYCILTAIFLAVLIVACWWIKYEVDKMMWIHYQQTQEKR